MSRLDEYFQRVYSAIDTAARRITNKLTPEVLAVDGMSALKNRIFLNELVGGANTRYMEIGVWQGSTFTAAMYKNNPDYAVAIDNFSLFDPEGVNRRIFLENCKKLGISKFDFLTDDCWNLDPKAKKKIKNINVYLYDGAHEVEDQRKAITEFYDNLADQFVLIVDDWNWDPARRGTYYGLKETNIQVHHQWALPALGGADRDNWWNGYYVAICEKRK